MKPRTSQFAGCSLIVLAALLAVDSTVVLSAGNSDGQSTADVCLMQRKSELQKDKAQPLSQMINTDDKMKNGEKNKPSANDHPSLSENKFTDMQRKSELQKDKAGSLSHMMENDDKSESGEKNKPSPNDHPSPSESKFTNMQMEALKKKEKQNKNELQKDKARSSPHMMENDDRMESGEKNKPSPNDHPSLSESKLTNMQIEALKKKERQNKSELQKDKARSLPHMLENDDKSESGKQNKPSPTDHPSPTKSKFTNMQRQSELQKDKARSPKVEQADSKLATTIEMINEEQKETATLEKVKEKLSRVEKDKARSLSHMMNDDKSESGEENTRSPNDHPSPSKNRFTNMQRQSDVQKDKTRSISHMMENDDKSQTGEKNKPSPNDHPSLSESKLTNMQRQSELQKDKARSLKVAQAERISDTTREMINEEQRETATLEKVKEKLSRVEKDKARPLSHMMNDDKSESTENKPSPTDHPSPGESKFTNMQRKSELQKDKARSLSRMLAEIMENDDKSESGEQIKLSANHHPSPSENKFTKGHEDDRETDKGNDNKGPTFLQPAHEEGSSEEEKEHGASSLEDSSEEEMKHEASSLEDSSAEETEHEVSASEYSSEEEMKHEASSLEDSSEEKTEHGIYLQNLLAEENSREEKKIEEKRQSRIDLQKKIARKEQDVAKLEKGEVPERYLEKRKKKTLSTIEKSLKKVAHLEATLAKLEQGEVPADQLEKMMRKKKAKLERLRSMLQELEGSF